MFALFFFFFNDTATTEIYTLSLHDALPIWSHAEDQSGRRAGPLAPMLDGLFRRWRRERRARRGQERRDRRLSGGTACHPGRDRKSTRLNSSHGYISYAVFCLKHKKQRRSTH